MPANPPADPVIVRLHTDADRPFLAGIAYRLAPGKSAWLCDPDAMARFLDNLPDNLLTAPETEAFVAVLDADPAGVLTVHPDTDYFTGRPRAHVDILVVAPGAEGRGVGRALLEQVERWARERGCPEIVGDVFADNNAAIAFYERCGFRRDRIRMAKPIDDRSPR
jgi:GNAT superfamily N-acetyltransferase